MRAAFRLLAASCALIAGLTLPIQAHDVPAEVTVVAFVQPSGQTLRVVARLPVAALTPRGFLFGEFVVPTRADGLVDLMKIDPVLTSTANTVAKLFVLREGERILPLEVVRAARLSTPGDRAFASYDVAVAHVTAPLDRTAGLEPDEGYFDAVLDYRITSDQSDFSLEPHVKALAGKVHLALRFLPPGGGVRAYDVDGDSGTFRLDPRWYHAAFGFIRSGFAHILDGTDHLLFLICLVIPGRRLRSLVPVVTAFTVAHSVTLMASAYGLAPDGRWFSPAVETLIAASIVYMAVENIVVASPRRRWIATFLFGLIHGFGFSFILSDTLQFAGSHLITSLLAFNVGVELGQLFVLSLAVPALTLLFRYGVSERAGAIVLSLIVAHVGWHWMIDRGSQLTSASWAAVAGSAAIPWLLTIVVVVSLMCLVHPRTRHLLRLDANGSPSRGITGDAAA